MIPRGMTLWRPLPSAHVRELVVFAVAWSLALAMIGVYLTNPGGPYDARVYWSAWHGPLYGAGFVYPPPGALFFAPAALFDWPAMQYAWTTTQLAALAWLVWPLPLRLRIPTAIFFGWELVGGNAAVLLAVPLALAPRWPILWTVLVWTKITPAIDAIVLLRQRRWRAMAALAVANLLVAALTVALAPGLVSDWLAQLTRSVYVPGLQHLPGLVSFAIPLWIRVPVAAAIAWAGWRRPWTLAVAALIATPDLLLATAGLLAAAPRLAQAQETSTAYAAGRGPASAVWSSSV